jgi:hypothetical protein
MGLVRPVSAPLFVDDAAAGAGECVTAAAAPALEGLLTCGPDVTVIGITMEFLQTIPG